MGRGRGRGRIWWREEERPGARGREMGRDGRSESEGVMDVRTENEGEKRRDRREVTVERDERKRDIK